GVLPGPGIGGLHGDAGQRLFRRLGGVGGDRGGGYAGARHRLAAEGQTAADDRGALLVQAGTLLGGGGGLPGPAARRRLPGGLDPLGGFPGLDLAIDRLDAVGRGRRGGQDLAARQQQTRQQHGYPAFHGVTP